MDLKSIGVGLAFLPSHIPVEKIICGYLLLVNLVAQLSGYLNYSIAKKGWVAVMNNYEKYFLTRVIR